MRNALFKSLMKHLLLNSRLLLGVCSALLFVVLMFPKIGHAETDVFNKGFIDHLRCVTAGSGDFTCQKDFSKFWKEGSSGSPNQMCGCTTGPDGFIMQGSQSCTLGRPIPAAGACTVCDGLYLVVLGIQYLFGISGFVALIVFTWSGLEMVMSQGESAKYKKGLDGVQAAVLGLVLILASWQIINLLTAVITGAENWKGRVFVGGVEQEWYQYCDDKNNIQTTD